jgi:hypothetical protein
VAVAASQAGGNRENNPSLRSGLLSLCIKRATKKTEKSIKRPILQITLQLKRYFPEDDNLIGSGLRNMKRTK